MIGRAITPIIRINRQDTYKRKIRLFDKDKDLAETNYTLHFTVRASIPSTSTTDDSDATISKVINIVGGLADLTISSSDNDIDPKEYYFDIQLVKDGEVVSSRRGLYIIEADITRAT